MDIIGHDQEGSKHSLEKPWQVGRGTLGLCIIMQDKLNGGCMTENRGIVLDDVGYLRRDNSRSTSNFAGWDEMCVEACSD